MNDIEVDVLDVNYIPDYVEKEKTRESNEATRISAENSRNENELERVLQEANRVGNEALRVAQYEEIKEKLDNGDFNGADGQDGEDGYSPTVSTSKSGKTTTIVITDKNGDHTATILDGEDGLASSGDMKKEVYDTNNNGIVDNAEKVNNHTVEKDVPANAVFTDTVFSGDYNDLANKPTIPTVPTNLSSFTDDLGNSPTHTHSQYLTSHQDISGKQDTLVSGTNIKTINNESILGSGDISISGGSAYTAGTNIEITSENVINNKIPYAENSSKGSISLGNTNVNLNGYGKTLVGYDNTSSAEQTVIIGRNSRANYNNSIAIGNGVLTYKNNQCVIGQNQSNIGSIDELVIGTTTGNKVMATQDYVDTAIATAITSALGGSY